MTSPDESTFEGAEGIWEKKLPRRDVLKLSALAAGGAMVAGAPSLARAAVRNAGAGSIEVVSLFDATGPLSIYGAQMTDMSKFAIQAINKSGGVLGKKLVLKAYDTQSNIALYSQYAQRVGSDGSIALVVGGITSASREAIRPVFDRFNKLYFYPVIYEGGVCDKLVFVQGSDPRQQQIPLIEWATKNVGKSFYTVAADYNYGHIASDWTNILVTQRGGKVLNTEFIPLDVTDFSSTIQRIQAQNPQLIMSHLVGANHVNFFRQFAAAGLKTQIVSPTFGLGNEEQVLTPAEAQGIVVAYAYFDALNTSANNVFKAAFRKSYPKWKSITELSAQTWNAWHLWALGVAKAGSLDQKKVIAALESRLSFAGPAGLIQIDPLTHHVIEDIHLARVNGNHGYSVFETFKAQRPANTVPGAPQACNLIARPNTHTQFVPK